MNGMPNILEKMSDETLYSKVCSRRSDWMGYTKLDRKDKVM